jgi:hypothetical protein
MSFKNRIDAGRKLAKAQTRNRWATRGTKRASHDVRIQSAILGLTEIAWTEISFANDLKQVHARSGPPGGRLGLWTG